MRRKLARWWWTRCVPMLGGTLAFVLACQPVPRGALRTDAVMLAGDEVHFVVRANVDALAHAESVSIWANVSAESVDALVLLPDDPDVTGISVGSGPLWRNLSAGLDLAPILRARCAIGVCELGLKMLVAPSADAETTPSAVELAAAAFTEPEGRFPESALLELEVDGEAPVVAVRSDR